MEELKLYVLKLRAENYITLYGEMQYGSYNEIVDDAFLFIGLGTSLLEAAGKSIPALVAIESDTVGYTYGAFHTLPENTVGDIIETLPKFYYANVINDFLKFTKEEYSAICEASFNKTAFYSIENVTNLLIKAFSNADAAHIIKVDPWRIFKFLFAKIQSRYFMKKEFRHK